MAHTLLGTLRISNSCYKTKQVCLQAIFYSSEPRQASKDLTAKVVNVAIIGAPNSGKSTLINKIVERKVRFYILTSCKML